MDSIKLLSFDHLKEIVKHVYSSAGFVVTPCGSVFLPHEVLDLDDEFQEDMNRGYLAYCINWEDQVLTESGEHVPAVYNDDFD
tara:strand:+ start:665 stop:913 length:249 start_codon:yes stop_codon:yes gene_type:complete